MSLTAVCCHSLISCGMKVHIQPLPVYVLLDAMSHTSAAVCGGASWTKIFAPHWADGNGCVCCLHDHCNGTDCECIILGFCFG